MCDLYVAIERDDINEVKRLINKDKSLLNTKIHNGRTPILIASSKERHSIVKYLLEEGADLTILDDFEENALHKAAACNNINLKVITLLLNKMDSCQINLSNNWGRTPLDRCYIYNYTILQYDIIDLLHKYGAKANVHDLNGKYIKNKVSKL